MPDYTYDASFIAYIRRFLNDSDAITYENSAPLEISYPKSDYLEYLKSYLGVN